MKGAVVLAAVAAAVAPLLAQDRPVFTARVEAVRVDVLATIDNRPLSGLVAADFELRDNGVVQQIDLVSLEQLPLNIVLAFDISDSVKGERLEHLRRASGALLIALKSDDRAALVTFSHAVTLRCRLSHALSCLRDELARVDAEGQTALVDGTYTGLVVAESEPGRSLLMVFGDRIDTASWLSPKLVLDTARRSEVVVYGIAAGIEQSRFLRDLTSMTGGRVLQGDRTADLEGVFLKVLNEFRQRYVLTYTPRGVTGTGWHQLQVRVRRSGVAVKARSGYLTGAS